MEKERLDYVLTFGPNVHAALWGAASWETSVHAAGPSVIANGPLAGRSLADVLPGFPLLAKTIDARHRLSVQVHPNERTAIVAGGDPKTEMWCLLTDGPVYAGLRPGVSRADVEAAVESGRIEELLVRHDGRAGDVFFVPGGLVHTIGDGVKLYEVQQSSDTTFRLYDWDRVDADGRPRELHIDAALSAMDLSLPPPVVQRDVSCGFFDFRQIELDGALELPPSQKGYLLYAVSGPVTAGDVVLTEGTSALVPPQLACRMAGNRDRVFVTRVL
jgi:mannose-6-phosphate isomerase